LKIRGHERDYPLENTKKRNKTAEKNGVLEQKRDSKGT
jgi:hypothetical protein